MTYWHGFSQTEPAVIEVWWVAERKPDTFSRVIMSVLMSDHSHVCFKFKDRVWHAVPPSVRDDSARVALEGSIIRWKKTIQLDCSEVVFQAFLEGEKGKEYSLSQGASMAFSFLARLPYVGQWLLGWRSKRACSTFVGNAVHHHVAPDSPFRLKTAMHRWTPPYLVKAWKADQVDHG